MNTLSVKRKEDGFLCVRTPGDSKTPQLYKLLFTGLATRWCSLLIYHLPIFYVQISGSSVFLNHFLNYY